MGKCPTDRNQVSITMHARLEGDLNKNRSKFARKVGQATDRKILLRSTCDMMMHPHSKVSKETLHLTQCTTELKPEQIIPVFAENNEGALTNCPTERRHTREREALSLVIWKTCSTV